MFDLGRERTRGIHNIAVINELSINSKNELN